MSVSGVVVASDLVPVVENYRTCEFLTVSKSGTPLAWPAVSVNNPDGTFTISTSIGLPQKAFNVRRNPQVAMLFSDPTGSGLPRTPQVLVKGTAQCPDEIVTSVLRPPGLWKRILTRQPESAGYSTVPMRRLMDFYYMRLLITVTPAEIQAIDALPAPQPISAPAVAGNPDDPFSRTVRRLPGFSSGVLCGFDESGAPTMTRVRPDVDAHHRTLRMTLPEGFSLAAGQGGLLCHSHDDKLAKLRSFMVTGTVTTLGPTAVLTPDRYIAGAAPQGPISMIKTIIDIRRTAERYLERRGLERPGIAWEDVRALKAEIKADKWNGSAA